MIHQMAFSGQQESSQFRLISEVLTKISNNVWRGRGSWRTWIRKIDGDRRLSLALYLESSLM